VGLSLPSKHVFQGSVAQEKGRLEGIRSKIVAFLSQDYLPVLNQAFNNNNLLTSQTTSRLPKRKERKHVVDVCLGFSLVYFKSLFRFFVRDLDSLFFCFVLFLVGASNGRSQWIS
jgi:hypothetical protein